MSEDEELSLQEWGQRWNKKVKKDIAFDPKDDRLLPKFVPLEIVAFDEVMGGGIPRGRITLVVGEESSGKTLFAQLAIAAAQRQGGRAIFIDAERCFSEPWFSITGVNCNPDKLIVLRPETIEQSFDMVRDGLANVKPSILVLDSISSMVPKAMMEESMDKEQMGTAARKITEGVKMTTQFNTNTAVLFLNQLRDNIGGGRGATKYTIPGGRALRFHSSVRISTARSAWVTAKGTSFSPMGNEDDPTPRIGFVLRLRIEKNKLAKPWQECEVKFLFNGTVDPFESLVKLAIQRDIIDQSGAFYLLPDEENKIHGMKKLINRLKIDDKIRIKVEEGIRSWSQEYPI